MSTEMPPFDYTKTPAYRRKLKRDRAKAEKRAGLLENQGPITMILVWIIDFAVDLLTRLGLMIWEFGALGFDFFYELFYGAYDGLIPNSEKFGMIVPMAPFRYLITLLAPPVGVFLSKGLSGWFNIIICFVLTYMHFVLGAIYAFAICFRNRYADRYEKVEYKRLMLIREFVRNCTGEAGMITDVGTDPSPKALIYTIVFFLSVYALIYMGFKKF